MKTITLTREFNGETDTRILRVEINNHYTWAKYAFATSVEYINLSLPGGSAGKTWLAYFDYIEEAEKAISKSAEFLVQNGWAITTEVSA
jgi:hypothetical protein